MTPSERIGNGEECKFWIPGFDLFLQPRAYTQSGSVIVYLDSDLHYKHQLISL
ncbi:hypothetical protein J6590_088107 [Homalodisca vitripennis]|nr:hypothetical protein J6590_088107 [Homalodisca vitripennis]